jgi:general secretion pathway protein A
MLQRYFGLNDNPFGVTPDPRFLYPSHTHREALASLQYAFRSNRGFTALIAPPGMGKTTLLFHFLDSIRESARSVFLFYTQCGAQDLIRYILRDLGVTPGVNIVDMHRQLNDILVAEALAGRTFVLIVDEAQNLPDTALETIRLLSNFETRQAKLMQIVLAGQPQLSEKLLSPSLAQLRQRISTICRLTPLSPDETTAYIAHRLRLAGYDGAPLFTDGGLRLIVESSNGIPRTINNLCFSALSLCCALRRKVVTADMVSEVLADQRLLSPSKDGFVQQVDLKQSCEVKRNQFSLPVKLRISFAAALVIVSVLGALWGARLHSTRYIRPQDSVLMPASPLTAPERSEVRNFTGPHLTTKPWEITVGPRQTLGGIAVEHLGGFDKKRLQLIRALNPGMTDPNLIQPGQKILLPGPPPD